MTPPLRVIAPRCALAACPVATGAPDVVTGGHAAAHAPVQLDDPPLSPSNRYTVSCLGPTARIVPNLLCFVVIWVVLPELLVVEPLDGAADDP